MGLTCSFLFFDRLFLFCNKGFFFFFSVVLCYKNYKEIAQAVIELAIKNELYTKLQGKSNYLMGDPSLTFLKKQIYPYWLMYLGADQEKMTSYMIRDRIAFDIDHYPIEPHLKKLDLKGFIEFCIRNQKHILRFNQLEII